VAALKSSQVAVLTDGQVGALNTAQVAALTTAQLAALSARQVVDLAGTVAFLTTSQFASLKTNQLAALTTRQIAAITSTQAAALTVNQVASLTSSQAAALTTTDLQAMSVAQLDGLTDAQIAAMSVEQTMALNALSPRYASPLILDLDGDGVHTLAASAGVAFDIYGNGKAVPTGWVSASDGLLVRDLNGDGKIDSGKELFGDASVLADGSRAKDGYAALAALDTNGDGAITRADAAYDQLQVWVDRNSDGISEASELSGLAALGIASISVQAQAGTTKENGNLTGLIGSWQADDGSSHATADVWFATPGAGTRASADAGLRARASALAGAIAAFGHDAGIGKGSTTAPATRAPGSGTGPALDEKGMLVVR
jgi:hypothetical protein